MSDFPAAPALTVITPSYPYVQHADDPNIAAFFTAYNGVAQQYLNTFNQINLPIYTGGLIQGALLDWVGTGLYGIPRPVLSIGAASYVAPINSGEINGQATNERVNTVDGVSILIGDPINTFVIGQSAIGGYSPAPVFYSVNDDVYRRVITWNFFKGDGRQFTIRWLKRRVMRFLLGENGVSYNVDQTYQVSITFGIGDQVNIRLLNGLRVPLPPGPINGQEINAAPINSQSSVIEQFAPLALADTFKAAVAAGVLQLPFQFTYAVTVSSPH